MFGQESLGSHLRRCGWKGARRQAIAIEAPTSRRQANRRAGARSAVQRRLRPGPAGARPQRGCADGVVRGPKPESGSTHDS